MSDIKIFLRKEKRIDNKQIIYLRSPYFKGEEYLYVNLKYIADHNSSIAVLENDFDFKTETVLKSEKNYKLYNGIIRKAKGRAEEIILKYQALNRKLTKTLFKNEFLFGKTSSDNSFLEYIEKKIKERRFDSMENKKLSNNSIIQHKAFLSVLKRFRKTILFSDINTDLIFEFKTFLKNKKNKSNKKYENSSINNLMRKLSQYTNKAFVDGFIMDNPFKKLKLREKEVISIVALDREEIFELINLYNSDILSICKKDILKQYLFSCFTGLRLSDIKNLKKNNFKKNNILKFIAQKNKRLIEIPLSKFALKLINDNFYKELKDDYLFIDHGHNKYYNQPLKKIINDFSTIQKEITFHSGRKTFATIYLNQNPEDYVTLSDYLGDTLEQTLRTYAKIITKTKADRISFLDSFISPSSPSPMPVR